MLRAAPISDVTNLDEILTGFRRTKVQPAIAPGTRRVFAECQFLFSLIKNSQNRIELRADATGDNFNRNRVTAPRFEAVVIEREFISRPINGSRRANALCNRE